MSALPEGTGRLMVAALVLIAAASALQRVFVHGLVGEQNSSTEPAPSDEAVGEGPRMDLAHLRKEDLEFLADVLMNGSPEGRRSAARALADSGDARGYPLLLAAARAHPDESLVPCLAALEILRVQSPPAAARELVLVLEGSEPLSADCQAEYNDRFGAVLRAGIAPILPLVGDPEPTVRAWLARALSEEAGAAVDHALLALAADSDAGVRRAAWLAWAGRDRSAVAAKLSELAAAERDPSLRRIAEEALGSP